ncbi:DUF2796 domain-containing protein [Maricaulis sp.]|uniref:ZrgA family zinc uptake protein n=1 Tax=Maricaulis sp. TaxID=1486257 RepID=UPI001B137202|nr:DUF2796 domain-containing protein [Maricaulis sp.]MBO6798077.1 DUF2796 domain-containing protein [Maricaulis sp.]
MIGFIVGAASLIALAQGHAHVHGHAELALALDGEGGLFIEFETPMDNVYGFEREPRNDAERAHIAEVNSALAAASNWIDLGRANCTLETAEIEQESDHGHGSLHITVTGSCERDDRMSVDLQGLFDRFAGLEEVELVVLSPSVQQGFELSPSRPSVRVGR